MMYSPRRFTRIGSVLSAIPAGIWFRLNSKLRFPGRILRPSVRARLLALTIALGVGTAIIGWRVQVSRTADAAARPDKSTGLASGPMAPAVATFSVNTLDDHDDGVCDPGDCTLREAIYAANLAPGDDTIIFSVSGAITLGSQLPNISGFGLGALTIDGGGQSITISGNNSVRVLGLNDGGTLTLQNLTIANGNAPRGGGVDVEIGTLIISNSTFSGNSATLGGIGGGGVFIRIGTLTIRNSTFSGNSSTGGGFGSGGGGVYNDWGSTLTISNSTFSGNSATGDGFGGGGGGVFNLGTLTISNSTFSGNRHSAGNVGFGGGVYNEIGALTTISNSTFSGNSATGGIFGGSGGGVANFGTLTLKNTIVANSPSGGNCYQVFADGFNMADDNTCGSATQKTSAEINLGPLANIGGPTQTMALQPGSAAIDAGDPNFAPPPDYDQRGPDYARVQNGRIDIGAYEFGTEADLSVTKGASPEPVIAGFHVTYTITVTNNGSNTAQAVVVTDNLPTETTFVSCNATGGGVCGGSGNNRTVTFSSLALNASETVTLVATVDCSVADGGQIKNTASVSSDTTDPDTSNNSQMVTTTASNPPPTIDCPDDITLEQTCPSGAIATYTTPVVTDNCPATPTRTAGPASGSVFPVGTTTVTYSVTDSGGNGPVSCSFTVTVLIPSATIENLKTSVNSSSLNRPQKQHLIAKLNVALDAISKGHTRTACAKLADFINSVQIDINHGRIPASQGQAWINSAARVRSAIGCTNNPCS